jgi:hypothetical protein
MGTTSPHNPEYQSRRDARGIPWLIPVFTAIVTVGLSTLLPIWPTWYFGRWESSVENRPLVEALQQLFNAKHVIAVPKLARLYVYYSSNILIFLCIGLLLGILLSAAIRFRANSLDF